MNKSNLPVLRRSDKLTVQNTTSDICRLLVDEVQSDGAFGKAALFQLANMFLSQAEDFDASCLNHVSEYLVLVGNASHRTTAAHITSYLNLRKKYSDTSVEHVPNAQFRLLLAHVITGTPLPKSENTVISTELTSNNIIRLETIVDDFNILFNNIVKDKICRTSLVNDMAVGPRIHIDPVDEQVKTDSFHPIYERAARILLLNFPLLRRTELRSYDDLAQVIQAEILMGYLGDSYAVQIKDKIETRIAQVALNKAQGGTTAHEKFAASQVLVQTKTAYLLDHGIGVIVPRFSAKHFSASDYESALINGVVRLGLEGQRDRDNSSDKRSDMEDLMYIHYQFRSKAAYAEYHERLHSRHRSENVSNTDISYQASSVSDILTDPDLAPWKNHRSVSMMRKYSRLLIRAIPQHCKVETHGWSDFFEQYRPDIQYVDPMSFAIMACAAGLRVQAEYRDRRDEEETVVKKPLQIQGVKLSHFMSGVADTTRLKEVRRLESDFGLSPDDDADSDPDWEPYTSANECYISVEKFGRNFSSLFTKLVTTYVNNNILPQITDSSKYHLSHFLSWRSPLVCEETYSPDDVMIAKRLLKTYSIFSQIPVVTSSDIINGVLLSSLQRQTNDYSLDLHSTITQNFAVRYLCLLGKLVEGAK